MTLRCLETVSSAASPGTEVILVEDAGEDGTAEAVRARFPRVRIVELPEQGGFAVAANSGLTQATGDLLLVLNSDTEIQRSALTALTHAFEIRPGLGVAGAALVYPDGSPQWSGGPAPGSGWLFLLASGVARAMGRLPGYRMLRPPRGTTGGRVDWVSGAALAIRRRVWQDVGPLDESFRFYCQDLDYCGRAGRAGWGVEVLVDFRVVHHHGATIGCREGAAGAQHPELLWTDLVRWVRKHRGSRSARRAARALRWGGRLRLAGLVLRRALSRSGPGREAVRCDILAYGRALDALARVPTSP